MRSTEWGHWYPWDIWTSSLLVHNSDCSHTGFSKKLVCMSSWLWQCIHTSL